MVFRIEEACVSMTPEERRVCLLTLGQVLGQLSAVADTTELGPGYELALDLAYSRSQHAVEDLLVVVEASYPEVRHQP